MSEKTKKSVIAEQLSPMFIFANIAVLAVLAVIIATALFSYHVTDPAWSHNEGGMVENTLGTLGAWYSDLSFSLIGKLSYLIPLALLVLGMHFWLEKGINKELLSWRLFMLLTAILSGCVLWTKHDPIAINTVAQTGGGALGAWLTIGLEKTIKSVPVIMAFSTIVFVISISLLFNIPWVKLADWVGRGVSAVFGGLFAGFLAGREKVKTRQVGMSSNAPDSGATSGDQDLQNKIRQLNAMAEKQNEKKPSFTIERYTADDEDINTQISTPPPSMAEPETQAPATEAIVEQVIPEVPRTPVKSEPSMISSQVAQPMPESEAVTPVPPVQKTQEIVEPEPMVFDRVVSEKPVEAAVAKKHIQEKEEPSFFDFGGLKSTFDNLRVKSTEKVRTVVPPTVSPSSSQISEVELAAEPMASTPSVTTESPQVSASVSAATPQMAAEVASTPITAIEPTAELVNALAEEQAPKSTMISEPVVAQELSEKATTDAVLEPILSAEQASIEQASTEQQSTKQSQVETVAPTVESTPAASPVAPVSMATPSHPEQPVATNVSIGKPYDAAAEMVEEPEQHYELPGINLLDTPPPQTNAYTEDVLADMAGVLERTLKQFNVDATVMHVSPGPVITRFEIDLAPGIQAKKITNLSTDLARALAVSGVRVEEVIPGNSYVGLEVPNQQRQVVYFKDVVRSKAFQSSPSPLTVSLGSDTSGKPVVADLMKMPHALVAGTTGSGKSVCINVMLLSMLFKATPKDLRLILVDPKMLEMSMYEDIPHLLTPVITDMTEAENALTWAVAEMERRYQLMAALKVRKIDAFNEMVDAANERGEPIKDPLWQPDESVGYTHHPNLERLPFIVIVIDELADMMMVVGKQVEQLIARLTQKARAAGIHVVLATQRPSTDVLTGLIKANVPTRVAFQVSSGTDSRVIIDGVGAEKLLGHGDMLYVPPGAGHPQRLHGAFVGDAETDRITNYIRSMGEPNYIDGITGKQDPETLGAYGAAEAAESKEDADELYGEAVQIVLETGKASISSVQRHLRIGYNRAARMIEDMQDQGIVSEPVNGVRKVLGAPRPPE